MRPSLVALFFIPLAACSRESAPPAQPTVSSTLPTQTALVSSAEPGAATQPGAATIPTNAPSVPAPAVAPLTSADEQPLNVGAARPGTAELAPGQTSQALQEAHQDKADSDGDRESVREIRALLAADKSLSSSAERLTIVAKNGRVRLSGQVNTAAQRAAIERAARQAVNVRDVRNELVVLE